MGKQRLLSLDALKGVAILMVIWGHFYLFGDVDTLSTTSYLHRFILAVHMSVFVLIAGYLSLLYSVSFRISLCVFFYLPCCGIPCGGCGMTASWSGSVLWEINTGSRYTSSSTLFYFSFSEVL